jgi:hypothetical protein
MTDDFTSLDKSRDLNGGNPMAKYGCSNRVSMILQEQINLLEVHR